MDKTLKTIQVFSKIGQVICKIIFIFCIVGAVGCAVGIASLAVGVTEIAKIGDVTIFGVIESNGDVNIGTMYASMAVALILCISELILARKGEKYFKNELAAGTPFTLSGAAELFRLGIYTICIPIAGIILAEITHGVISHFFEQVADLHIDDFSSAGLGIAFIAVSFLCKYGAQILEEKNSEKVSEESKGSEE